MTRKLLLALVCLLGAPLALQAQNWTTVSATNITDLNQNKLAVGQLCFLATDQNDNPINFQVGGGGQVLKRAFCSGVTSGALAVTLTVPNPAVSVPSGIYYRVTVRDTTTGQEVLRYPGVTFSGAAFNFDLYAPANVGQLAPLSGNAVSGNLSVNGNLNLTGTLTGTLASPLSVGGVNQIIGPDTSRFGAMAFRIQPTAVNSQATLTLMPSGTGNTSEIRLYNSSDPLNTGTLEFFVTGPTVTMSPAGFGTGVAPNLLDTSAFPTFKAANLNVTGVVASGPLTGTTGTFSGAVTSSTLRLGSGTTFTGSDGTGTNIASNTGVAILSWGCTGTTAPNSSILPIWGLPCSNGTGRPIAITAGTIKNLFCQSNTAGVNASSGVVTIRKNGVNQALTCTFGATTACNDTTHSFNTINADKLDVLVTSQLAETLADVTCTVEKH